MTPADSHASGTLTVAVTHHDPRTGGPADAIRAFPNANVSIDIATMPRHEASEKMPEWLAAAKHDLFAWHGGLDNKRFASQGLLSDISDVWNVIDGLPPGYRTSATADDGHQYFLPTSSYVVAVHYSRRLFADNGYTPPTTGDELFALCEQMRSDGVTPFASPNDGEWPAMSTFDLLNMRLNGYGFHLDLLAGHESWADDRVRQVFGTWSELLPFHEPDANRRPWQQAARSLEDGTAAMLVIGTFVAFNSEKLAADVDFFNFPALDPAIGATAIDAPTDGYQMVANAKNPTAAKELLRFLSTPESQNRSLGDHVTEVASNPNVDSSHYDRLQKRSLELLETATQFAHFFDRDTDREFAPICGRAFAKFLDDPSSIDESLRELDSAWSAIAHTKAQRPLVRPPDRRSTTSTATQLQDRPQGAGIAHSLTMGGQGELVVPADLRMRHGLEAGTPVTMIDTDDGILVLTPEQLRRQARRALAEADHADGRTDEDTA